MEYQVNNLHNRSATRKNQKINYDTFCKIVGKSCIIEELRENLFGTWLENAGQKQKPLDATSGSIAFGTNISATVSDPRRKSNISLKKKPAEPQRSPSIFKIDPSIAFEHGHYFEDVETFDDCSMGQRNYKRNLEGLLANLLSKKDKAGGGAAAIGAGSSGGVKKKEMLEGQQEGEVDGARKGGVTNFRCDLTKLADAKKRD